MLLRDFDLSTIGLDLGTPAVSVASSADDAFSDVFSDDNAGVDTSGAWDINTVVDTALTSNPLGTSISDLSTSFSPTGSSLTSSINFANAAEPPTSADIQAASSQISAAGSASNAMTGALQSNASSLDWTKLIPALATAYAAITVADANANVSNATAQRITATPAPGTTTAIKGGGSATVNADGSTTVTSPTGQQYTIEPSGAVVQGGASIFSGSTGTLLVIGGIALLGILAFTKG